MKQNLTALIAFFMPFLSVQKVFPAETCGRVATINHQEILLDTNSTQKGEGLRYYLEKDDTAKHYLDIYQKGTQIHGINTLLGTLGPGLLLASLFTNSNHERKKAFLSWGAVIVLTNFLVTRTMANSNESNLIRAIEEYNKRNSPKIRLNPNKPQKNRHSPENDLSFFLQKTWEF